ncbi:MAG: crossover junction endodeoxyribonuclease RuvC [Thermodesulfovibrionales bacterium]|nr:crossover junction endodeoxyribonuclease RuvC [Thermodesulfovibrionales bacterium]
MRKAKTNKGATVLGIDPGSRKCGFGVLGPDGGYLSSGTIVLPVKEPLHIRLRELYDELTSVIEEFRPSVAAVEKVFFAHSAKSALTLGQARGVALLAASVGGLEVREYSATEVKKAVTGYGRAEKVQVQDMVKSILGVGHGLSPDGADAIAVAICHLSTMRLEERAV